jgi:hypothetical protein
MISTFGTTRIKKYLVSSILQASYVFQILL